MKTRFKTMMYQKMHQILCKWKKPAKGNPMVVADKGMNDSAFRDPTTSWLANGYWNLLVGSKKKTVQRAYLFKNKDLKKWIKHQHPLHSIPNTGMPRFLSCFKVW